jgi:hypothetical protein
MKDKVLNEINGADSYEDLLQCEIIDNIYKCNPIDKALLMKSINDKVASFGRDCKKLFNNFIKDYEKTLQKSRLENECDTSSLGISEDFNYSIDTLSTGEFKITQFGIYDKSDTEISPTPIVPYCLYRKNIDNVEKVRILYRKNDKWQSLDIDRLTISNQSKIIDLSNHGIGVSSANALQMVKFMNNIFDLNVENIPVRDSVARLGWVDNNEHFIPYNSETYDFVLSVNDKNVDGAKQTYDAITTKGDYDIWFDCMKKMRTNIPTRLAFGASAISPLLTILGSPCFVTLLYGKTGTGKTLSCRCAMSMWGDPNVLSMRADSTTTSIVRKCLFFNNLPLFVDEFQLLKQDYVQEFLMSVTEGIQRTRATMDSSNNFTSSGSWKNCTLITGERQCVNDNIGGGAVNRIIELRIDDMVADEMDLQDIYYKIDNNYGFLGKKLIDLYSKKEFREKVKKRFAEIQDSWRKKLNTASKQLIAISCLVLGDEILREHFFHDDNEISVEDIENFVASSDDISYSERVYNIVCDMIFSNQNHFARGDSSFGNNGVQGELWGAIAPESDNKVFYIIPSKLKEELSKRFGINLDKSIKEDWRHKGYIDCTYKNEKFVKYAKKESINGIKRDVFVFHTDKKEEEI